ADRRGGGAGWGGGSSFANTWLLEGNGPVRQGAVAALLPGRLSLATQIMHGCSPASAPMTITKIEGNVLYEIDGRPALTVILETMGMAPTEENLKNLTLTATIGKKTGDPYAPFREEDYVNRLIVAALPQPGAVVLFDADFEPGATIRLMTRDNEMMLASTRAGMAGALARVPRPALALYVDCAGRHSRWCGADREEADLVREGLEGIAPLLGFYSGVEIAPMGGRSRALDWTGVLTLFTVSDA
ncbi:MAG: FIST C-terminal domain-containing protein, partial [Nitrospinae bacterium]|nr:FIST C-terminal domain-containing protein [Nitrospinota bacterium]